MRMAFRFDIEDRKGLEIVLLTALLTFQDVSDAYHEPNVTATATPHTSAPISTTPPAAAAPTPPPKPVPKKGIERIAELQLGRGQVNEVTVLEEGAITDYAKHCARLLQVCILFCLTCPLYSYLFIVCRTMPCCSSACVPQIRTKSPRCCRL